MIRGCASWRDAIEETREHLRALFDPVLLSMGPADVDAPIAALHKGEQRRWQRNSVRGGEPAHIVRELLHGPHAMGIWRNSSRRELAGHPCSMTCASGSRNTVSPSYAQELKTMGPISAARLERARGGTRGVDQR